MQITDKIIFISQSNSKRLNYIIGFISDRIGIKFEILPAATVPENSETAIIHYGSDPVAGAFNIYATDLLFETRIKKQDPSVLQDYLNVFLFPSPAGFDLPFDILAAAFYMISRYEEYLPFIPDIHGRFEADQSLAFANGFLEQPVVDQWIGLLRKSLQIKYPGLRFRENEFQYISTFDIDNPWAYRHKSLIRNTGGLFKAILNRRVDDLKTRFGVMIGNLQDPFDTYLYIKDLERKYNFNSRFFFLSGNYGGNDVNFVLNSGYFRELVRDLGSSRLIGIHPSYKSHLNFELLKKEYDHFSQILGRKPDMSRQHFLMLKFPETYHQLISLGIKQDYTMGYASHTGFRAGTSIPFSFFDLSKDCETDLMIYPCAVMDVTFARYLLLSPPEAQEKISIIMDRIKKVKGVFTSLWHNESLSESGIWKGWRRVFEGMVAEAVE